MILWASGQNNLSESEATVLCRRKCDNTDKAVRKQVVEV